MAASKILSSKDYSKRAIEAAEHYIADVRSKKIRVGKLVRRAVNRHVDDLKTGSKRGLYFDIDAARRVFWFFSHLQHSKGRWAGQQFILAPWEAFILYVVFGWKRKKDNMRRFRQVYVQVAKKNGKSTLAAGVGLYLFCADREPGAEVYCAATKRDQARIVYGEAERMVRKSPDLASIITMNRAAMSMIETESKFLPLGKDSDTIDGINTSGAVIDELHAHKTRDMYDQLETSSAAREQPLIFIITTAGSDETSVCFEVRQRGENVLDPESDIEDEELFAYIAELDKNDRWLSERNWIKANPNLNITVFMDDLRAKAKKAKESPGAQNAFRRFRLDEWTEQTDRIIDMDHWDNCPTSKVNIARAIGFGGLDLSSTQDVTAFAGVFPPFGADDLWRVEMKFWVPAYKLKERSKIDGIPYDRWVDEGYIKTTPGNVIDYHFVENDILDYCESRKIERIGYDPFRATEIIIRLQDAGLQMEVVRQGFLTLAAPTQKLIDLIASRKFVHNKNPVLRWMAGNVAAKEDPAGNLKPDKGAAKGRRKRKIDGVVAVIIGLALAISVEVESDSVYKTRGLLDLRS